MKIKLIIFFTVIAGLNLWAFQPQKEDFVSDYQYSLYRSWLTKTHISVQVAAGFSQERVVKIFNYEGEQLIVEYPWEDHKIIAQLQKLEIGFDMRSDFSLNEYLVFAEKLIYRLNSNDKKYAVDLLSDEIEFIYAGLTGKIALDKFWSQYHSFVILPGALEIISEDKFGFKIPFNDDELTILFSTDIDLGKLAVELTAKEKMMEPEPQKSSKGKVEIVAAEVTKNEVIIAPRKEATTPKDDSLVGEPIFVRNIQASDKNLYNLPLVDFIRKAYNIRQSKELLNNKVKDVGAFLDDQFPQAKHRTIDDVYYIQRGSYHDVGGDVFVQNEQADDSVNILPFPDYEFKNNHLILPNNEKIDLSALDSEEIDKIAAALPQLVYLHRALGTKLVNFLMIHDDVPTTLIVHSDKRELYEIYSYANLLLMLSEYWEDYEVYFKLNEVKKVNGKIELVGYLIAANDTDKYDMAEIWFCLDEDCRFDLIMMMLYPQLQNTDLQQTERYEE